MLARFISCLLILCLFSAACLAVSDEVGVEAHNFWQEIDIIFFQTLPFAAFWGHVLDQNICANLAISGAPHWNAIVGFAVVVSAVNAKMHAQKVSVDIKQ